MNSTIAHDPSRDLNFDQLMENINKKDIYLIDVREKKELEETGILPSSINIPLGEVKTALTLSETEFEKKYGAKKPDQDNKVVFSCRSGKRSLQALDAAMTLGYKNSYNYAGGWLDWEKRTQKC